MGKAKSKVRVWFDPEGDLLEVILKDGKGFFKHLEGDTLIRVNEEGEVLGFMILNVTKREAKKRWL
ncbi:MAG: DUF2283 domain-containing protein [archaeon]|nr:DUF2283 domain-containing protein [archaeon]